MHGWAILSGLGAATAWGAGDFAGGLASRRAPAVRVVVVSQLAGTAALIVVGLFWRQPSPRTADLLWSALAGAAGGIGLLLLYTSLARGKMGLAAPLTAVATGGVPLITGLLVDGIPGAPQLAGFALALPAIWIISRPDGDEGRARDAVVPLLAGVGFGIFLTGIGRVSDEAGLVWPLVAARAASLALLGSVAALLPTGEEADETTAGRERFPWRAAFAAGLGDTAGNALFATSVALGRLDVAAVLGALYPAVTVALAQTLPGEQLAARQRVGVGLALVAVVLIAL